MSEEDVPVEKHLDVAGRFLTLAEASSASDGDTGAWSIVLAFYAAVHWVRAYIRHAKPGAHIASHDDVRHAFQDYPELRRVKPQYDGLKQLSHKVRYYGELSYQRQELTDVMRMARQVRDWAVPKIKRG